MPYIVGTLTQAHRALLENLAVKLEKSHSRSFVHYVLPIEMHTDINQYQKIKRRAFHDPIIIINNNYYSAFTRPRCFSSCR